MLTDKVLVAVLFLTTVSSAAIVLRAISRRWDDIPALTGYWLLLTIVPAVVAWCYDVGGQRGLGTGVDTVGAMAAASGIFGAFYASLILAYWLAKPYSHLFAELCPRFSLSRRSQSILTGVTILLTGVNLALIAGLIIQLGGFFNTLVAIRAGALSGHLYSKTVFIASAYLPAALFSGWLLLRGQEELGASRTRGVSLAGLLLLNLSAVAVTGDRDLVAGPLLLILLTHFVFRRGWGPLRLGFLLLPFLLLFAYGQHVRQEIRNSALDGSAVVWTLPAPSLISDFASTTRLNASLSVIENDGVPFEDYLMGLIGVVPRSLWADKPERITSGARIKDDILGMRNAGGGWPVWPPVLAFRNGGLLSVLLIGGLSGLVLVAATMAYGDYPRNPYSMMMVIIFVSKIVGGGLRSSFFSNVILFIAPFIFLSWMTRLKVLPGLHPR